ncbi:MAG: MmcQ-like protein [Ignavibacteriales bacterium CG12_big_fil_rev_8_21_14_0_65_30_8]|nr:MAG: MmcQ-like protein [Ignavibacteriales bacterium CG12_big_fil_rev_8_21_14_0_65_30_8]
MNIEMVRNYCLAKKGVTESLPFDEVSPVYKVMGKMFLILSIDLPHSMNVKCDPEIAIELRERYDAVMPGYHMNKIHWNTVMLDGTIPDKLIYEWIDDSYNLIVSSLKKSLIEELKKL